MLNVKPISVITAQS